MPIQGSCCVNSRGVVLLEMAGFAGFMKGQANVSALDDTPLACGTEISAAPSATESASRTAVLPAAFAPISRVNLSSNEHETSSKHRKFRIRILSMRMQEITSVEARSHRLWRIVSFVHDRARF